MRVSIVANGVETLLNDDSYVLNQLEGFGLPPIQMNSTRGPLQHGETLQGFYLQPRKIVLGVVGEGGSVLEYLQRRDAMIRLFRPRDTVLSLRVSEGDFVRQIDVSASASFELPFDMAYPSFVGGAIELTAYDPVWYDPTLKTVNAMIGAGSGAFTVPVPVPWAVGSSVIGQTFVISYVGSWISYPIVRIRGPVTSPIVTNQTTGKKLDFTGTTIDVGEEYVIDCRYGYKTVKKLSDGSNRIAELTTDSDLSSFAILPDPDVPSGQNSISVSGVEASTATAVFVQYFDRYVGV
jgi:hypothetical protein